MKTKTCNKLTKLNFKEVNELAGLYCEYYDFGQISVASLGRMRVLERKASEEQLREMLSKVGQNYDEVFA